MQLGLPDPLEEYVNQFLDTKVARQYYHMELFDKELIKPTALGDHNLVHSIKIVA